MGNRKRIQRHYNSEITHHHLEKKYHKNDNSSMASVERRKYYRYDIQQEIRYISPDAPRESFTGVIKNISHSGLCLYALDPVRIGQEITIKSKQELYRKGTVVWFRETGEKFDIYKVGLQFV